MKILLLSCVIIFITSCNFNKTNPIIKLDSNLPKNIPQKFAPEFISSENGVEFSCTISPDLKEFYFTRRTKNTSNQIFVTKYNGSKWSDPIVTQFSKNHWCNEPSITPDGKRMYFGSKRKLTDSSEITKDARIWYCEKQNESYSKPKYLAAGMMYVTATKSGDIYYTDKSAGSYSNCFLAKKVLFHDKFGEQQIVNIPTKDILGFAHPYISPNEDYLIYDSNEDLYIVFKINNEWSSPIKFDETINTKKSENCAYVSPDGNYLFFSRFTENKTNGTLDSDIYWVSSDIIKKMRKEIDE